MFALGASALSLGAYWWHPALLENLDQRSRDVVFRWREPPIPPPEVAVVSVDERSVKQYGRWPWPRSIQADLITGLKQAEAGVIALDIVYARLMIQTCDCTDQDAMLKKALGQGADQ